MRDTVCFYFGKAGSSTVIRACESLGIHCSRAYDRLEGPQRDYRYVVTLAREPVARNLSAFFDAYVDRWVREGVPSFERMTLQFLKGWDVLAGKGGNERPLFWFDRAMLPEIGLNVYREKWSAQKGWAVYEAGDRRVLVIRTDRLTDKLAPALQALYEDEDLEPVVEHRAKGTEKYGHGLGLVYGEWLDVVKLPAEYLDWMYGSDYARHFWFKTELARFRKRWGEE